MDEGKQEVEEVKDGNVFESQRRIKTIQPTIERVTETIVDLTCTPIIVKKRSVVGES